VPLAAGWWSRDQASEPRGACRSRAPRSGTSELCGELRSTGFGSAPSVECGSGRCTTHMHPNGPPYPQPPGPGWAPPAYAQPPFAYPPPQKPQKGRRWWWLIGGAGLVALVLSTGRINGQSILGGSATPVTTVNVTVTNDTHQSVQVVRCGWTCLPFDSNGNFDLRPGGSTSLVEEVGNNWPLAISTPNGSWIGCIPLQYPPDVKFSSAHVKISSASPVSIQACIDTEAGPYIEPAPGGSISTVNVEVTNDTHQWVQIVQCGPAARICLRFGTQNVGSTALSPGGSTSVAESVLSSEPLLIMTLNGSWIGCIPQRHPPHVSFSKARVYISSATPVSMQACLGTKSGQHMDPLTTTSTPHS
jgi:hypothetical protein